MPELRHQKLTYEIRGMIFEARRRLRTGWPEDVYHQGLVRIMEEKGAPVVSKPRKMLVHRGIEVHLFECDLIAWDLVILELKALPFTSFAPRHYAQLINYLKLWGKDLGLLVNFGPMRAEIERVVWDEPELVVHEDYSTIEAEMTGKDRECLFQLREDILVVGQQYGLGYPEVVYRKIAAIEFQHDGLCCQTDVEVPARLDGRILTQTASDHLLVNGAYLLNIRSLLDQPPVYEFARTKTYLNNLGLKLGFVVNFGKKCLQIYGVSSD